MGSCAAPSAKGDDKFITTDYLQQCPVIGIGGSEKQAREGEFDAVMLAPKSTQMVKSGTYNTPYLSYINDYGGRPVLQFSCGGSRCTAVKK